MDARAMIAFAARMGALAGEKRAEDDGAMLPAVVKAPGITPPAPPKPSYSIGDSMKGSRGFGGGPATGLLPPSTVLPGAGGGKDGVNPSAPVQPGAAKDRPASTLAPWVPPESRPAVGKNWNEGLGGIPDPPPNFFKTDLAEDAAAKNTEPPEGAAEGKGAVWAKQYAQPAQPAAPQQPSYRPAPLARVPAQVPPRVPARIPARPPVRPPVRRPVYRR